MTTPVRFASLTVLALSLGMSAAASAQTLPWKTDGSAPAPSQSQGQSVQPPHSHHHRQAANSESNTAPAHAPEGGRAQDDKKLNELATKFYAVTKKDPQIIPKLKKLSGQVQAYRNELKTRSYDVSDISKDAQNLEFRINRQRKELEAEKAKESGAAAQPVSAPVQAVTNPVPSGTSSAPVPPPTR